MCVESYLILFATELFDGQTVLNMPAAGLKRPRFRISHSNIFGRADRSASKIAVLARLVS